MVIEVSSEQSRSQLYPYAYRRAAATAATALSVAILLFIVAAAAVLLLHAASICTYRYIPISMYVYKKTEWLGR